MSMYGDSNALSKRKMRDSALDVVYTRYADIGHIPDKLQGSDFADITYAIAITWVRMLRPGCVDDNAILPYPEVDRLIASQWSLIRTDVYTRMLAAGKHVSDTLAIKSIADSKREASNRVKHVRKPSVLPTDEVPE